MISSASFQLAPKEGRIASCPPFLVNYAVFGSKWGQDAATTAARMAALRLSVRLFYMYEGMFSDPANRKIAEFLTSIGLEIVARPVGKTSFLPGILIEKGVLVIDESAVLYPGDILHEAGHLAVAPREIRGRMDDEVELPGFNMDSIEAGAIAWSYAAALHIGIDPSLLFHEKGYKGNSKALLMNFSYGIYIGVNVLEEAGMAVSEANSGETIAYPNMIKWLRD